MVLIALLSLVLAAWAAEPPAPRITLTTNAPQGVCFRGWPCLITLRLEHPSLYARAGGVAPLRLAAAQGPWTNILTLRMTDVESEAIAIPLLTQAAAAITLDHQMVGEVAWVLSPEATAQLTEGPYTLTAVLDTGTVVQPDRWQGVLRATCQLKLVPEPAELTPEQVTTKELELAGYDYARGAHQVALARLDVLLGQQPELMQALILKAMTLDALGRPLDALRCTEAALAIYHRHARPGADPPLDLLALHHGIIDKLLLKGDKAQ
jgi:tetratricopeptide (TPR) repeat protein